MPRYLLSIYHPDGPPPPAELLEPIMKEVDAVRDEMQRAGAWVFGGGLHESSTATVVRVEQGELLTTDGPFIEGKEHIGGFCVVTAANLDEALGWGGKLARAMSGVPIEVRPFRNVHDTGDA